MNYLPFKPQITVYTYKVSFVTYIKRPLYFYILLKQIPIYISTLILE